MEMHRRNEYERRLEARDDLKRVIAKQARNEGREMSWREIDKRAREVADRNDKK